MAIKRETRYRRIGTGLILMGIGLILEVLVALLVIANPVLLAAVAVVPDLVLLIGFIFVIAGWGSMERRQRRFLLYGLLLYLIVTVVFALVVLMLTFNSLTSGAGLTISSGARQSAVNRVLAQTSLLSPIAGVLGALALLLFPYGFTDKKERKFLYSGLAASALLEGAHMVLLATGLVSPPTIGMSGFSVRVIGASPFYYLLSIPSLIFGVAYYLIGRKLRRA